MDILNKIKMQIDQHDEQPDRRVAGIALSEDMIKRIKIYERENGRNDLQEPFALFGKLVYPSFIGDKKGWHLIIERAPEGMR